MRQKPIVQILSLIQKDHEPEPDPDNKILFITFRCEVSAEAPSFRTKHQEVRLNRFYYANNSEHSQKWSLKHIVMAHQVDLDFICKRKW